MHCAEMAFVEESYYNEEDEDSLDTSRSFLKKCGIPFNVLTFREAVQLRPSGWSLIVDWLITWKIQDAVVDWDGKLRSLSRREE
ncbi:MAG TPA: hypothetical protein PLP42_06425 [Acidobacteriota bacterium]|nr:hypothetical protein [Acidobacteriota bacterium]